MVFLAWAPINYVLFCFPRLRFEKIYIFHFFAIERIRWQSVMRFESVQQHQLNMAKISKHGKWKEEPEHIDISNVIDMSIQRSCGMTEKENRIHSLEISAL